METVTEYKSLNDIRIRKEMLRNDILKDDQKIRTLWHSLFKPSDIFDKNTSPSLTVQYWVGSFTASSNGNRFTVIPKFNTMRKKSACFIMQADFVCHVNKINPFYTKHFGKGNGIINQLVAMMFPLPS